MQQKLFQKEAREELIQRHINKSKSNISIEMHMVHSYDECQEGDKWKELRNNHLKSTLNRQLCEPEELVLHKNRLVCITHNKIISNSIQVLCSQGSLAMVKDFNVDQNRHLESVDIALLRIRFYSTILETWIEATLKLRTAISILGDRGCKIRRM